MSMIKNISLELQEYFNLNENEVIPPTPDKYPDEFEICINNSHHHLVEVVTFESAFKESEERNGDITPERLTIYKRLNNSNYYWRWL